MDRHHCCRGLISFGINLLFGGFDFSTDGSTSVSALSIIGGLVSIVVSILIQAAYVRGALHEVDGNKPAFGSFFQFSNIGAVILASILVGFAVAIGLVLLIIPGIVIAFLTYFTLQFVIDQDQDPVTAIKSSASVISKNVGHCFYWHSRQSASTSLAHCSAVSDCWSPDRSLSSQAPMRIASSTGRFVAAL